MLNSTHNIINNLIIYFLLIPAFLIKKVFCFREIPRNLDKRTTITIGERTFVVEADDLEKICDLGRGAYGIVEKMRHKPSETIMAVKVISFG